MNTSTKKRARPAASESRPSAAEMIALREQVLERIRALLAERQMAVADIAGQLGLKRPTVYRYMCYLDEMGEAHRTVMQGGRQPEMWAAGRAPLQEATAEELEEVEPSRAWIVPARQIGMQRDPLVAALFGPARGAAS
jgi:AraC-like DNA-binding protein